MGESGTRREELGAVVGTRGAAVRGWTSEGFYKNNSLTDNLLASSLQRPQVPFGEGSFLFQLHRESPESQGWSLWVLIAFFPLFYQSAYSDEGKKGMKALQTLMKRSTNSFFFVDSPPAGRDELWRRKRSPSSSLFDWLTLRSAWRVWLLYHSVWWKHASQTCQKENPKTETQAQHVVSFKLFYCCFFLLVFDAFMWKTKEGWLHRRLLHSWMFWTFNSPSEKFCCSQRRRLLKSLMFDSSKFSEFYSPESRSINNKPDLCLKQACIDCMKCICYYISISLSFLSFTFQFFETAVKLLSANVSH